MDWLIWIGTALAVIGLAGLIHCIVGAMKARKEDLDDAALDRLSAMLAVAGVAIV